MSDWLYLDNNATTRLAPEVLEAMLPCFQEHYGNPSSAHVLGLLAEGSLVQAREQVAGLLNCQPAELVFNGSGTEGLNHAFRGVFEAFPAKRHFITTAVEHSAVLALVEWLRRQGAEVTVLPVDGEGRLDLDDLEAALRPDTGLVSVMAANNETGVCFPLEAITRIVKARGALLHVDGTRAGGKLPLDLAALPVDLLNLSAHKLHGPKGVGALFIRRGLRIKPFMVGGHQERGRRGGTENLPGLVGFGRAAALAQSGLDDMARPTPHLWKISEEKPEPWRQLAYVTSTFRPPKFRTPPPWTSSYPSWQTRPIGLSSFTAITALDEQNSSPPFIESNSRAGRMIVLGMRQGFSSPEVVFRTGLRRDNS